MSKFIKQAVQDIEISGIRQFNQYASTFPDAIKLTIGELPFDSPAQIKESAINAINENHTRYTENKGLITLRQEITANTNYIKDECILTVGTTEGIAIVIKSIIDQDDEIIIPTPGYVGYEPLIKLEGGKTVYLDTTNDYLITREKLESCYTKKTKALLITNPNNPTGHVLTQVEMDDIRNFVIEKDIVLIVDEIYSELTFVPFLSFTLYPELKEHLILLNGFSKSHAMTGFRIGYILSSLNIINHLVKVHQYNVTSTSTISQYALLGSTKLSTNYVQLLQKNRDYIVQELNDLKLRIYPNEGAFYLFIDVSITALTGDEYCKLLLEEQGVALIPGQYFLGNYSNYVRLSFATELDVLKEAMRRIKIFHENIKQKTLI